MHNKIAVIVLIIAITINCTASVHAKCTVEQRIKLGDQGYDKTDIDQFCSDEDEKPQDTSVKSKKATKSTKKETPANIDNTEDGSDPDGFTTSGGFPGTTSGNVTQIQPPVIPPQLSCCDAYNIKRCAIVVNPGPLGSACYCNGVPGVGYICM